MPHPRGTTDSLRALATRLAYRAIHLGTCSRVDPPLAHGRARLSRASRQPGRGPSTDLIDVPSSLLRIVVDPRLHGREEIGLAHLELPLLHQRLHELHGHLQEPFALEHSSLGGNRRGSNRARPPSQGRRRQPSKVICLMTTEAVRAGEELASSSSGPSWASSRGSGAAGRQLRELPPPRETSISSLTAHCIAFAFTRCLMTMAQRKIIVSGLALRSSTEPATTPT